MIGANGQVGAQQFASKRRLADLVDHPASRAPAKQHRACALEHFDFFVVERVAVVLRHVALAVAVHIIESSKTAQNHLVAAAAAFAGGKGDAGDVLQHVFQIGRALLGHQIMGHHTHRLRHILELLLHAAQARGFCLVALHALALGADDFYRGQGFGGFFVVGIRLGRLGGVGQRRAQRHGQHAGSQTIRAFGVTYARVGKQGFSHVLIPILVM